MRGKKWVLTVATTLSISGAAFADGWLFNHRRPTVIVPSAPAAVAPAPIAPVTPQPMPQPAPQPMPATAEPPMEPSPLGVDTGATPSFSPLVSAALGDTAFSAPAPGYLDSALPQTQIRLRYDLLGDMNRPDRAEYFYAKCGCFGGFAPGPRRPETGIQDAQEASLYVEYAPTQRFSAFIDTPFRAINPEVNDNASGFGDIRFGFKYAFLMTESNILTFQVRGFAPTGDARRGLGTDHASIEPSLLYLGRPTDKITLYGQFGEWIPIDGTDFAGNILIYGAGAGYTIYQSNDFFVTPLAEIIGWSVLDGNQTNFNFPGATQNAGGDQITNGKLGVRAGNQRHDVYVGYGRALTGDIWYQDIVRFEYRLKF